MAETLVNPYLFFSGNCEEALDFYRTALGATVDMIVRFDESPDPPPPGMVPPGFEKKIMHATFHIGGSTLMASDGCGAEGEHSGFSLSLVVKTEADADRAFAALAKGGEVKMPLGRTFWSPSFGMLKDRFGIDWMINTTP